MKLKLDDAGHVVVSDGKPVYVHDDGKEVPFDAAGTVATIGRLNGEAKTHREAREAAEKALKAFEGLDGAEARKALETVKGLDAKKLIDAGEVDKVKAEIARAYDEKLATAEKRATDLEGALYGEKIGGAFARSKFIADKMAVPADLVQARFGQAFKIEDGKVVAYDQNGNKLYSKARPGEPADFEEALGLLVDNYPYRDTILKGNTNGGGSTRQSEGGGGKRQYTTAEFNAMGAKDRAAAMAAGATVTG